MTVPLSSTKDITAFGLTAPAVDGVIDQIRHTVALTVPFGTEVGSLIATFTSTGASVTIGGTPQISGVTPNDFSDPATYMVAAADGSMAAYDVTVTVAAPVIGQDLGGGKLAYILQSGDPGYVAGQTHGLIAAAADQGASLRWDNGSYIVTGAAGTGIGTGFSNSVAIVASQGESTAYAARLARAYAGGGRTDWYLPSLDELAKLYENRAAIGGFFFAWYWTSSEFDLNTAWAQSFNPDFSGFQSCLDKEEQHYVRAVRSF